MLKKDFGIRKNFHRVREIAAQGLGRAEKTEVLSVDLQNAEKRVEVLRTVVQNMIKRLTASLQAHNIQDTDKRAKKMPIVHMATSMKENSEHLGDGLLKEVLAECSRGLELIGYEQQSYELILEKGTLVYFQQLIEVDIPAIKKSKQALSKLTLDMDATKSRQQAANKESSLHPSSHNQTKTETLNSDLEDAEVKVAACKDQYATEMLTFLSKESEICLKIVEWMDAQVAFYRKSVQQLDDLLPDLKCMIDQNSSRPVYGCPLEEHLQTTGKEVATVIETCVSILYHNGMEEEGLFRIAGSSSKLKKLKAAFNAGNLVDIDADYYYDYHVVAGALKQYIRELPEPLLTFHLYKEFIDCMSIKERGTRLQALWSVVDKLPPANLVNVRYLIKFLWKLSEKQAINKMTPANIAIVFGPNLLWPESEDSMHDVVMSTMQNQVVETLVQHHEYFFPQDVTFADVASVISPQNSTESLPSSQNKEDSSSNVSRASRTTELSRMANTTLSTSQHSLTSTDSGSSSYAAHSPYNHRKSKKPAPPPPPSIASQISREVAPVKPDRHASKPDRPEGKPDRQEGKPDRQEGKPDRSEGKPDRPEGKPDRSEGKLERGGNVKKPEGPPPGPPPSLSSGQKSASRRTSETPSAGVVTGKAPGRPNNPPPPTPSSNTTSPVSMNPFLDSPNESNAPITVERSMSEIQSSKVKTHIRNASADLPGNEVAELRGHNRTKSHDLRLRQPPPIPQRTHTPVSSKSSTEHKHLLETTAELDASTSPSSEATNIDSDLPSANDKQQARDIIQETDLSKGSDALLARANSVTDHTAL